MIKSIDARTGTALELAGATTGAEVASLCERARRSAHELDDMGRLGRAALLHRMADALEARRSEAVETADRESALGPARLGGELTRATFQLRFFAEVLLDGAYLEATIDHAGDTPMGPRPDLRRILRPLGPVAVFGASNFPFAFSVPGGDTASALAAGCPVLAKAHDAHPATSVLCADALAEAARSAGLDGAVVSLVLGEQAGVQLVRNPAVAAVGFTGSLRGGRYLFDVACGRPSPIPFYGELGALNAVVVGEQAAARRGDGIASGLAASFTLGVGQFCTKPGLVLVPAGGAGDELVGRLAAHVGEASPGLMLSERIATTFSGSCAALRRRSGLRVLAEGGAPASGRPGWWGSPLLVEADAAALADELLEECFGPLLVVVRWADPAELQRLVELLGPALTATVHADGGDAARLGAASAWLACHAGRLVWNGFPTGLAVSWATHHGGAYPAATDPLHTSVGAAAIRRWLRPICFQDTPETVLPPELVDRPSAEHRVPRRVDGRLELPTA